MRYLIITKIQTVILTSHLQEWNLLEQGFKVSYRKRQQIFSFFFSKNGELVYCNDVEGLMQELGFTHHSEERIFFLDFSKFISKTVPLHSGNIHSSIPIAQSVHMKKTYENMDLLLKVTQNVNGKYVQILKS